MGVGRGFPAGGSDCHDVWYICRLLPVGKVEEALTGSCAKRSAPSPQKGQSGVHCCCHHVSHCCAPGETSRHDSCARPRPAKMDTDEVITEGQDVQDASFKGCTSSEMGSPGSDQTDQLTMVEEMVMEMKTGFVTVLEELAKIQFDEKKQKEWLERTNENERKANDHERQISQLTETVEALKAELTKMSDQMKLYVEQKDALLQELERTNQLSNHSRERVSLKTEVTTPQSDFDSGVNLPQQCGSSAGATTPPGLSPMVKSFMESLPTGNGGRSGEDHYDSDSVSITALANRSLRLTETLRSKYQYASSRDSSNDGDEHENSFEDTLLSVNKMNGGLHYHGLTNGNHLHDQAYAEKQRQQLTSQILSSERKYCSTLWTLIDDYITPLRQLKLMSSRELNSLFPPYLSQMYAQHCSMLRKLEDRVLNWRWNGTVGDIFAKLTDTQENELLSLYREYVSDFPTALHNLNKWKQESNKFNSFLKNHHHGPGSEGTDVTTLILAPVQRLAHYVLFIKDLLLFTDDNHADRYYLVASLALLRNFLSQLNDEIQHIVQLVEEETSTRKSSRSAASVKSSGSSCEVNHVLSARDSGIHSTGEEIIKLHQSLPPRQMLPRHSEKPDNQKYHGNVTDAYSRRLFLATSQPNIHRLTPGGTSQRLEPGHALSDMGTKRPAGRERARRSQGRKTVDSFPMLQTLSHRSASPSPRHSAIPRLQLEDYYEPGLEAPARSYRDEPVYKRPCSVAAQSCGYEDYEMDRLTQLAQNRPRSAAEQVLLRDEMFHTDAEAHVRRMLVLQSNYTPQPQPQGHGKSRDRLSLTPAAEQVGGRAVRQGRPQNGRKASGIDQLLESGLLIRGQSPHSSDHFGQDYGIYGDNDDEEEEEEEEGEDYRLGSLAADPVHPTVAHRPLVTKSKSQGNVPVALSNGYQCEGNITKESPRDRLSHTTNQSDLSISEDQIQALVEQNLQPQHITTKALLEMTHGQSSDLTTSKPTPTETVPEAAGTDVPQGEDIPVTSVPPTPSTLPRPDSRQGRITPLKLPKKKTQEKAKLGFSATLSRSVDDVSKSKKKNSIRDSLKNIFNKRKGSTQSAGVNVDPETPCSSDQVPAHSQPLPAPADRPQPLPAPADRPQPLPAPADHPQPLPAPAAQDVPPSPDSGPRSPDWVLQGSSLSQLTLTPLPRQKPPRKPPRARRPATLTGTFRDETGEPYSPV